MKKFKHLVIGGIETKVIVLVLVIVVLMIALMAGVTLHQSNSLAGLTAETNARQQEASSELIGTVMDQVVRQSMSNNLVKEAAIYDGMFRDIKGRVTLVAEYAATIFANPSDYSPKPWSGPDPALNGQLVPQVLVADGVDSADPEIAARIGLVANMSDVMVALCDAYGADNAYIGLPEGIFLTVNRTSADWYLEDGTLTSYDPRTRYWYQQAVEAGGLVFSDLENDATTGELSVTCAMPVYGPDGTLAAVAGADIFLSSIRALMTDADVEGGSIAIINKDGHVIYSSTGRGVFEVHRSAEAVNLLETDNAELVSLVSTALQEKTDVRLITVEGSTYYAAGAPVETVGWALLSGFSREVMDQPVVMLQESNQQILEEARGVYRGQISRTNRTSVILLGLLALAAIAAGIILSKRIVKPLNTITKRIANLSEENLEFKMEDCYRTGDEIEVLAESFANISHKTVEYVGQVRRVTAEKERIGTELHMANQIQESMLPSIFPAFPDRKEFDIYASMDPAKEVGGDFYDFFLIDEDHLCIVIADVSGKGVPAALFMMASKIILQSCAMLGRSAGEILTKTNEAICSNNKMEMFVTVWLGILEISSGVLRAASAGHEYPALLQDGRFALFRDRHGFVIGGMDGVHYKEYEMKLKAGDKLFVYTDGVAEATNADEELFGTERMLDALNKDPGATPEQLLGNVRRAVDAFVGDAEQFDDLTMLCVEYKGPGQVPKCARQGGGGRADTDHDTGRL